MYDLYANTNLLYLLLIQYNVLLTYIFSMRYSEKLFLINSECLRYSVIKRIIGCFLCELILFFWME